jgi:hypothetical protein
MDNKQWIVTAALAGIFASAFMYLPYVGHLYVFVTLCALQGLYLGWQPATASQARLGALSFSISVFVATPILGLVLSPRGLEYNWGIAAGAGIAAGVISIFGSRFVRIRRTP